MSFAGVSSRTEMGSISRTRSGDAASHPTFHESRKGVLKFPDENQPLRRMDVVPLLNRGVRSMMFSVRLEKYGMVILELALTMETLIEVSSGSLFIM